MEFDFNEEPTLSCEPPLEITLGRLSFLGNAPVTPSFEVSDSPSAPSFADQQAVHTNTSAPTTLHTVPVAKPPSPSWPSEDAFVAAKATVRAQAYEELGSVLKAGHMPEHFAPWFQEMLRDVDNEAFVAACSAVSAHYQAAQERNLRPLPPAWVSSVAERLKLGTAGQAECDAAAGLFASTERACRQSLWAQITELLCSEARAPETWWLLAVCAERRACSTEEIRLALVNDAVQQHLQQGGTTLHSALRVLSSAMPGVRGALPAANAAAGAAWEMSPEGPQRSSMNRLAPDSPGAAQLLSETSVRSWRCRLKCLQELKWPVEDGLPPAALWPHLVLQTEDDHPAVSAAALQAVSRLAPHLCDPGDLLATRLATVLRHRLRDGRARSVDAATTCIADLARHGVFQPQQLATFLSQALGCTKERAKATVAVLREEWAGTMMGAAPPSLSTLLNAATSGRRAQSGPSRQTPSRRSQTPTTPSPRAHSRGGIGSPLWPGGAHSQLAHSPQAFDGSSILPMPAFSPEATASPICLGQLEARAAVVSAQPLWQPNASRGDSSSLLFDSPEVGTQHGVQEHPASLSPDRRRSSRRLLASGAMPQEPVCSIGQPSHPQTPPRRTMSSPFGSSPASTSQVQVLEEPLGLSTSLQPGRQSILTGSPGEPQLYNHSRLLRLSRSIRSGMGTSVAGSNMETAMAQFATPMAATSPNLSQGCPTTKSMQPVEMNLDGFEAAGVHEQVEKAVSIYTDIEQGLSSLQSGRTGEDLMLALRTFAQWKASTDAELKDAEVMMRRLSEVACSLPVDLKQHMWEALWELADDASGKVMLLPLIIRVFLTHIDPKDVAAYLAKSIASGAADASGTVDFCMAELPIASDDAAGLRLSQVMLYLAKAVVDKHGLHEGQELSLPSLSNLMEWATSKAAFPSVLPTLRVAVELLVQHLSPVNVPRTCWRKMRDFLASGPKSEGDTSLLVNSEMSILSMDNTPEASELSSTMRRLQRLVVELSKAETDEVAAVLQQVVQVLSKPAAGPLLRSFCQRLLQRQQQRSAYKENMSPLIEMRGKKGGTKEAALEFLDDDYACTRELCADEGLAGAFPNSLIGHLKRLLSSPVAAGTARGAADCVAALVDACGSPILRLALRHFIGPLLRLSAARGPSQAAARSAVVQLISTEAEDAGVMSSKRHASFRLCWKAMLQAAGRRGDNGGDATLLTEALRCFAEDVFPFNVVRVDALEARELLTVAGPALRDRSVHLRRAASEAISALVLARGREDLVEEDIQSHPQLPAATKAAALAVLSAARDRDMHAVMSMSVSPAAVVHRSSSMTASLRAGTPRSNRGRSPHSTVAMKRAPSTPSLSVAKGQQPSQIPSSSQRRRLQFSPMLSDSPPVALVGSVVADRHRERERGQLTAMSGANAVTSLSFEGHSQDVSPAPLRPKGRVRLQHNLAASERLVGTPSGINQQVMQQNPSPSGVRSSGRAQHVSADLNGTSLDCLEDDLREWVDELRCHHSSSHPVATGVWQRRTSGLRSQVETYFGRYTAETTVTALPGLFLLCQHLVACAADCSSSAPGQGTAFSEVQGLMEAAQNVVRVLQSCLDAQVVKLLCTATAATIFRAALHTLAVLQVLSSDSGSDGKESATVLVMDLPPIIAQLLDIIPVHAQLLAWLRVGGELLMQAKQGGSRDFSGDPKRVSLMHLPPETQQWALKFCTRCVERLLPQLPGAATADFPAWEVLSQLSQLQSQPEKSADQDQLALGVDLEQWHSTLEAVAHQVAQLFPSEVKEFLLLATCTGSPVPKSLAGLGDKDW
mmetsp:Transcript_15819/g.37255  ORF Transcript_15819/g.37255 Transcript_15819/m.37255 type:complete len:1796 (+) Transcript_15819:73-5460(+)